MSRHQQYPLVYLPVKTRSFAFASLAGLCVLCFSCASYILVSGGSHGGLGRSAYGEGGREVLERAREVLKLSFKYSHWFSGRCRFSSASIVETDQIRCLPLSFNTFLSFFVDLPILNDVLWLPFSLLLTILSSLQKTTRLLTPGFSLPLRSLKVAWVDRMGRRGRGSIIWEEKNLM